MRNENNPTNHREGGIGFWIKWVNKPFYLRVVLPEPLTAAVLRLESVQAVHKNVSNQSEVYGRALSRTQRAQLETRDKTGSLESKVRCHYNKLNFLYIHHNIYPIAHLCGQAMGCLLWVQNVLPQSLQHCMQSYNGIRLNNIASQTKCPVQRKW